MAYRGVVAMTSRHARVARLDRYVRIPTVSRRVTPEMVEHVRAFWQEQGLALEPLSPPGDQGTPALWGEIPGPAGAPTVLLYGHYDVQPTGDLARWVWDGVPCEPFAPTYFHDGRRVDPATVDDAALDAVTMVARGGADNKGQHLANVLGALDAARAGTLRWRVRIILDGEEEHGSPHLGEIARAHRARLAADVVICSDGPKQKNRPTLVMGVRGMLEVHLTVENGQRTAVHSGNYGNIVANPVLPLARLIEDLQGRVREFAQDNGAFRQAAEAAFARWEREAVWKPFLWPYVNANHLATEGTSLEQRRTVIPRAAHARVDIRLTPDTSPEAMSALVYRAVADHQKSAEGVTFQVRTTGQPASYTSPDRPEFAWLLRLLGEQGDGPPVALPTLGGTLPTWVFTQLLGIPTFVIPSANSDNQQHDVNEHYVLRHFFAQIALYDRIVSSRP
jgi:acetylornithine deacetylase/succinyl-diaminopimelate desuccinylase-like protein